MGLPVIFLKDSRLRARNSLQTQTEKLREPIFWLSLRTGHNWKLKAFLGEVKDCYYSPGPVDFYSTSSHVGPLFKTGLNPELHTGWNIYGNCGTSLKESEKTAFLKSELDLVRF